MFYFELFIVWLVAAVLVLLVFQNPKREWEKVESSSGVSYFDGERMLKNKIARLNDEILETQGNLVSYSSPSNWTAYRDLMSEKDAAEAELQNKYGHSRRVRL